MPSAENWEAFAGLLGVVVFLGGGLLGLQRLGLVSSRERRFHGDRQESKLEAVEAEIQELKLSLASNYVRRDDWVPSTSRIIGLLEQHSVTLAKLEERMSLQGMDR